MNHYITWKKFEEIGYDKKHLIDAPIPANSSIYKLYDLTEAEYYMYGCDICFVCHASDADVHIQNISLSLPEDLREICTVIYRGYKEYVYETGNFFYRKDDFKKFVEGTLKQVYFISLSTDLLEYISKDMYMWFNQKVFRQVLVDWLIDTGFSNIKLWGKGWETSNKYKKYAMGVAENGETLSKIYQASKIVIGNNIMTTSAARAWEAMLSGAFYLSNYIPPEDDAVDIRKIVKIDEEVIMFYNKSDFLQKVEYYLSNEEERQKMREIGHKVALERMTFDGLAKKILKEIPERLEQLERGKV